METAWGCTHRWSWKAWLALKPLGEKQGTVLCHPSLPGCPGKGEGEGGWQDAAAASHRALMCMEVQEGRQARPWA